MSGRTRAAPEPAQETAEEIYARAEESAERAMAAAELARKVAEEKKMEAMKARKAAEEKKAEDEARKAAEAKKAEDEAKKKAAEAKKADEAKKKGEAKKAEEGKKKGEAKKAQNGKGKSRQQEDDDYEEAAPSRHPRRDSDAEQPAPATRTGSSKTRKSATKMPSMINDAGQDISNEMVRGGDQDYPSCRACIKAGKPCEWKMSVIHLRLSGLPNKAKNCENCVRKQIGCQFLWDREDSLKRLAEEPLEPETSKRIQLDSSSLLTCLQSIDKNLSALVKFTAAQAVKTSDDHKANTEMFEVLKSSLDGLHGKVNGL